MPKLPHDLPPAPPFPLWPKDAATTDQERAAFRDAAGECWSRVEHSLRADEPAHVVAVFRELRERCPGGLEQLVDLLTVGDPNQRSDAGASALFEIGRRAVGAGDVELGREIGLWLARDGSHENGARGLHILASVFEPEDPALARQYAATAIRYYHACVVAAPRDLQELRTRLGAAVPATAPGAHNTTKKKASPATPSLVEPCQHSEVGDLCLWHDVRFGWWKFHCAPNQARIRKRFLRAHVEWRFAELVWRAANGTTVDAAAISGALGERTRASATSTASRCAKRIRAVCNGPEDWEPFKARLWNNPKSLKWIGGPNVDRVFMHAEGQPHRVPTRDTRARKS